MPEPRIAREPADWESAEGSSFPLGHSWVEEEQAHNFALYSKHAHSVELLFFGQDDYQTPVYSFSFNPLKHKSGPIWHCRLPESELAEARFYAYRVDGPGPGPGFEWHTFDPEKLLLDPYAKGLFFPPEFDRRAAASPGSNAGRAPLAILILANHAFDWGDDRPPRHCSDLVIYEMHVRGFTQDPSSGVSDCSRGTFAGILEKIPYLKELGITAIELMPIFQFDPQDGNYWGYMPMSFFAPHHAYSRDPSACQQHRDFRELVKHLHDAGMEVILDVVFNHTAEGDEHGPTYSYKGIDNSTYYVLSGDPAAPYENFSGTGNTLHTANRAVRQLIVDSLRYWVKEMHVDGFRFDLASVFTRTGDGSINLKDPPIFGQISAEPELAKIRLIAEPWDAGGAYQLGSQFPGQMWMQWNGRYRDTLRRFVRGDGGLVSEVMTRLYGSSDLFPDDLLHACRPWQSVNYISSHDGYTLYDIVSYNHRHNEVNGHNNTDGEQDGSWNCGWEGDDDVPPEVMELRKQQVRNYCSLLMLANGPPMFRMGDEFLQTQGGNNNPYNQDNATTWLDWSRLKSHRDMFRFFQQMIAFRKQHPSISRSGFWRDDVAWYGAEHNVDMGPESRALAYCLHGAAVGDSDLYVMINASDQPRRFGIHEGHRGVWRRIVDTARKSPDDFIATGVTVDSEFYNVSGRSVVVLERCR